MADQELRDRNLRLIGRIKTRSDGVLEGWGPASPLRGRYDPKTNETRDPTGRLIGRGNLLASLIKPL